MGLGHFPGRCDFYVFLMYLWNLPSNVKVCLSLLSWLQGLQIPHDDSHLHYELFLTLCCFGPQAHLINTSCFREENKGWGETNWLAWVVQSCLVKPSEASGSSGVEAYGTSFLWKNSFGLKSLNISVFKWHVVWTIAFGKTTERKNESRITAFGIERRKWG